MPKTSVSRIIAAPQQEVWAILADIANAGRWNSAWSRIEITSSHQQGPGTSFLTHTKDGNTFAFEVIQWTPPEYITFAPIREADSELYPINLDSHSFALHPTDDNHTQVRVIACASSRGIRGRLISLFLWRGFQKQGLNSALDSLQKVFERPEGDGAETEESTSSGSV